jgi:hypothetical protein
MGIFRRLEILEGLRLSAELLVSGIWNEMCIISQIRWVLIVSEGTELTKFTMIWMKTTCAYTAMTRQTKSWNVRLSRRQCERAACHLNTLDTTIMKMLGSWKA